MSLTLPLAQDAIAPEVSVTDFDHKVVYARLDRQFRVAAGAVVGRAGAGAADAQARHDVAAVVPG